MCRESKYGQDLARTLRLLQREEKCPVSVCCAGMRKKQTQPGCSIPTGITGRGGRGVHSM
jgi:hypothetical protein